jgi:diadenosine tetraphosphatase ApaH/serine/threonine PP2A family protein phosphatase
VRYLILSDIHANWEALQKVMQHAAGFYDKILNCGDLVGYGPDPNRVVEFCRGHDAAVVRGNHDKACVGLGDLDWFNPVARASALWTRGQLTPENRIYLEHLPTGPRDVEDFQILHGSPADEDEYLVNVDEVQHIIQYLHLGLSFFGHTHLQGGFLIQRNGVRRLTRDRIDLEERPSYLINPGSVGQPRDGDPRAAYALYNTEERSIQLRRVEYDASATARKIVNAGLPDLLARRLMFGL